MHFIHASGKNALAIRAYIKKHPMCPTYDIVQFLKGRRVTYGTSQTRRRLSYPTVRQLASTLAYSVEIGARNASGTDQGALWVVD